MRRASTCLASPPKGGSFLPTYLVERYLPALLPEMLEAHAEREREAMARVSSEGIGVRHLRSTYLRQDELLFSLFEGPSLESVREAIERAGVPFERITEAIDVISEGKG